MEALLRLLDLHLTSAFFLSSEAIRNLLALIRRHVAFGAARPLQQQQRSPREEAWDPGVLLSRLFGFYYSTLSTELPVRPCLITTSMPSQGNSDVVVVVGKKSDDDTRGLRKALLRLLSRIFLQAGSRNSFDPAYVSSVFAAIHEAVQLFLPQIQAPEHPFEGEISSTRLSKIEVEQEEHEEDTIRGSKRKKALPKMTRRSRLRPCSSEGEEAGSSKEQREKSEREDSPEAFWEAVAPGRDTMHQLCGRAEETAALAYFFALQARREQEPVDDHHQHHQQVAVGECMRVVSALSALCFAGQQRTRFPALLAFVPVGERYWRKPLRRCLPWIRKSVHVLWAIVRQGCASLSPHSPSSPLNPAAWSSGRTIVRYILDHCFALAFPEMQRLIGELFSFSFTAVEGMPSCPPALPRWPH